MQSQPEPKAAYIHVPFCRQRCGYCNFTLVADRDDLAPQYLQALALELSLLNRPRAVETIFLGGGTPSHLAPADLRRLLDLVCRWFPLEEGGEFSTEANPDDINTERLECFRDAGATRISLGAQSFLPHKLAALERTHDAETVARAVELCRDFGFDVSLDLIYGAPQETLLHWKSDLSSAAGLNPDHVSTYGLTYERGAAFWARLQRGDLSVVGEEVEAQMYESAIDDLTKAGFEHYEVSNFAKPGKRCRHNETYWLGKPYFAAGPGASRFIDGRRETNHRSTSTYIRRVLAGASPVQEIDEIPVEARFRERFVFAMRRREGIDTQQFAAETGVDPWSEMREPLERFIRLELLERDGAVVRLTRTGLLVSDSMWSELL